MGLCEFCRNDAETLEPRGLFDVSGFALSFCDGGSNPVGDALWYDPDSVKTGYEVSFTRYFYKPQPLRALQEIRAYILALEKETEGLMSEIIGGHVP